MHNKEDKRGEPMTELEQVQAYIHEKIGEADARQENRVVAVHSRLESLTSELTSATNAMRDIAASLDKHQAVEEQWKEHHVEVHNTAIMPRISSLEDSRKFVTNKVLGYTITAVLGISSIVGGLVFLIKK